jgi:hypothetical protein
MPFRTGRWIKDREEAVQRAIETVFATFRSQRSLPRTCRALVEQGISVPSRRYGVLKFRRSTVNAVGRFIRHPAYYGAYVFGLRHRRRLLAGNDPIPESRLIGQVVQCETHHEPYISQEEFAENQKLLAANRWPSVPGRGESLLQGLLRCACHGTMNVNYSGTGTSLRWCFHCMGEYFRGGKICSTVPGRAIETLVIATALDRLQSPRVEELRKQWVAEEREARRNGGRHRFERRRAEMEVEKATHRYDACDPANEYVMALLARRLNERSEELARLRAQIAEQTMVDEPFTPQAWNEVQRLCRDVRLIWNAPSTAQCDRKQILRMLIRAVVVQRIEPEWFRLRIEWLDADTATAVNIPRPAHFHQQILALHNNGVSVQEIVTRLNNAGARTRNGGMWLSGTVRRTIGKLTAATGGAKREVRMPNRDSRKCQEE